MRVVTVAASFLLGCATGPPGGLQFVHAGVQMACISDTTYGRMRVIAPIRAVARPNGAGTAARGSSRRVRGS